ncbi:hypothetical protein MRX96_031484 [Rhipicephalus microplus]
MTLPQKVEADTVPERDTSTIAAAKAPAEDPAVIVIEEEEDYDMLLMGDDSILVAATQEVDVSSPARKYSKTPTGANKGQLSSLGRSTVSILDVGSPTTLKTPPLASPVHRKEGRSTPNWNMGGHPQTKKPAELVTRAVPANPGEVSKRVEPAKTAAAVETAASVKTVELEKTVELAPAIQASSRTSSTDLLFEDDDEDELLDQICCTYEQQQQLDAKMAAAASASLSKMLTSSPVTTSRSTTLTFQSATVVPSVASKTTASLISEAEAPKATQARVILEQCVAASAKAPPLGKEQSPSSALVSTAPKLRLSTKSPLEKSSHGTSPPQSTIVKTSSKSVDAALDFDDDDLDLATPEVMSWLEEVESQPCTSQALHTGGDCQKASRSTWRRRLREQESNMWKGRLRMSK